MCGPRGWQPEWLVTAGQPYTPPSFESRRGARRVPFSRTSRYPAHSDVTKAKITNLLSAPARARAATIPSFARSFPKSAALELAAGVHGGVLAVDSPVRIWRWRRYRIDYFRVHVSLEDHSAAWFQCRALHTRRVQSSARKFCSLQLILVP